MDSQGLSSLVELSISCRNLRDLDVFSKSDPMCVVYYQPQNANLWTEIKRTEIINNCLNPNFATKVNIVYKFEEQQKLKFEIYDVDSSSQDLSNHDFIGYSEFSLGQIVASGCFQGILKSKSSPEGGGNGTIIIIAEELESCKKQISLELCGAGLPRICWFCKPSVFLEFYKTNEAESEVLVHRTEVYKSSCNPKWKPIVKTLSSFCSSDEDRCINVRCYSHFSDGNHQLLGEFHFTIRELSDESKKMFVIHNTKKQKSMGTINVLSFRIEKVNTFLDYLKGGTNLQCTIGIDFTASNGDPTAPNSLHYQGNLNGSQYSQAIIAVGNIIQDYDSDKMFPVLGFGARVPPHYNVSHEFFVNGKNDDPYCYGVQGILEAYKTCIPRVQLYGPTNFAPIIKHVIKFASAMRNGDVYFILVILTDGVITDMPQTKQAIIEAADLPMSIIIVGVGNADFDAMEELDADVIPLKYQNRTASRDIVQFVPFNKFKGKPGEINYQLAQEVLKEIPDQFLSYMKKNNILPRPPRWSSQNLPQVPEQF